MVHIGHRRPWVRGERLTLGDIVLLPNFARILCAYRSGGGISYVRVRRFRCTYVLALACLLYYFTSVFGLGVTRSCGPSGCPYKGTDFYMTSLNAQALIDEWNNGMNLVEILEIMVPQV